MTVEIDFDPTDSIAVGAVGPPGQRTFYLQARSGPRTLTMVVEKAQVRALAERAVGLLADNEADQASDELIQPVEPDWRAGQLGLGFDSDRKLVVLVAQQAPEGDDADPDRLATARLWLRPGQVLALSARGLKLVAAGRPLCLLCGLPLDPEGHLCPRKNGKSPIF